MNLVKTFDHVLWEAGQKAIKVIDGATTEIQKLAKLAANDLPVIEAVLTNPIVASIASALPGGTADLAAIVAILNRFQNAIAQANDAGVLQGLQTQAIAEVTSLVHGAQMTIGEYAVKILKMLGI